MTKIDRQITLDIDRRHLLNRLRSVVQPPPKPSANPPELTTNPSDTTPKPMQVDEATEGKRLRKRKEKIPKNLKREANEKEMDGFTKRVLRIPVEKPFDEVYFTHRETKETEEDIRRMFHHVREKMKQRITLKKKTDPGKFAIPCVGKGIEFPHPLCDTGASVSILPKVMADQLDLKIEPSSESFTFVELSERSSGGIIRDLEVQIDPDVHYDPVRVVRQQVNLVELGNDLSYIAACHCGAEYETEYTESIDTHTVSSIDSNESPTTDERYPTSLDGKQPVDHLALLDQCYPDFAFQQPNNRGRDDYSIGSWADSGLYEVLEWIL
uniref:Aspartic peptidase DDI1-type domain-containing protein n=1 Tax=Brassica oleracea var. oleracea TaxID=109376 RepID=A0A0D2ZQL1_BRAOL